MTEIALVARVESLRAEVSGHKAAIGQHRRRLHEAKTELTHLEAELTRRGIGLHLIPALGVGAIHGHRHTSS